MNRLLTPSQTVGPFFSVGLPWPDGHRVVPEGTPVSAASAASFAFASSQASRTAWPI